MKPRSEKQVIMIVEPHFGNNSTKYQTRENSNVQFSNLSCLFFSQHVLFFAFQYIYEPWKAPIADQRRWYEILLLGAVSLLRNLLALIRVLVLLLSGMVVCLIFFSHVHTAACRCSLRLTRGGL